MLTRPLVKARPPEDDSTFAVKQEVQAVVDYSRDLEELAGNPDMPKGLGKVTVYGGKLEAENKTRELRDVFRYRQPLTNWRRFRP